LWNGTENIMENKIICVVGLGYVGLPLAVEFSKFFRVIGFDIDKRIFNRKKIEELVAIYWKL